MTDISPITMRNLADVYRACGVENVYVTDVASGHRIEPDEALRSAAEQAEALTKELAEERERSDGYGAMCEEAEQRADRADAALEAMRGERDHARTALEIGSMLSAQIESDRDAARTTSQFYKDERDACAASLATAQEQLAEAERLASIRAAALGNILASLGLTSFQGSDGAIEISNAVTSGIAALRQERKALVEYGQHHHNCAGLVTGYSDPASCDCGFLAAITQAGHTIANAPSQDKP